MTWSKSLLNFIGIAIFVILANICTRTSGAVEHWVPINFTNALVVQSMPCNFTALDLNDNYRPLNLNFTSDYGNCTFDFYLNETMYFMNQYLINSTSENYPTYNLIGRSKYALAVDSISKKIYGVSWEESYKLIVVDMVSKEMGIILTDLTQPKYIQLDPAEGYIFIGQLASIVRVNMDGTSPRKIIVDPDITELAIDRVSKRIYWANTISIESSNYDGTDRREIVDLPYGQDGVAVAGDRVFWLTPPHGMLPHTTITTCTIGDDGVCGSTTEIPFEKPIFIKAFDFDELNSTSVSRDNPCEDNNGGCQQLCLLANNDKGYTCGCTVYFQLNEDFRTCKRVEEYLLYVQGNYIRGRVLKPLSTERAFTTPIYPIIVRPEYLSDRLVISFDYDFRKNNIFFNDDYKLFTKYLDPSASQIEQHKPTYTFHNGNLAYDWITGNLYAPMGGNYVQNYLKVYNKLQQYRTTYCTVFAHKRDSVEYVAVHPIRGYVYFTLRAEKYNVHEILRINSDGSLPIYYKESYTVYGSALGIDYVDDRVYWFNEERTHLESADLDGNSLARIDVSAIKEPRTIYIYGEYAYVTNLTGIWQFEKKTGEKFEQIIGSSDIGELEMIAGVKIYGSKAQKFVRGNPCAVNNGGCQEFCFGVPTDTPGKFERKCDCQDSKRLQADGKTCV